jgi:phospholipid/cholesterol/gamma-HCH transport system permease protein
MTKTQSPAQGRVELSFVQTADVLRLTIQGQLDGATLPDAWERATAGLKDSPLKQLIIDVSGVTYCDGAGLSLFVELRRQMALRGGKLSCEGGTAELRRLLEISTLADPLAGELVPVKPPGFVEKVGQSVAALGSDIQDLIAFTGEMVAALVWACAHPLQVRGRDTLVVAEKTGVNAVAVITLLGALVGAILAFQMAVPLQRFGAVGLIPSILGVAVVRELGPLITAIILAGRSGSAFAAEIGTMKVTEEVNALKTFGLDPVRFLVIPRVLATVAMTPLLTIANIVAGVLCGYFVMMNYGYSFTYYFRAVTNTVTYTDLIGGLIKAPVFGLLVAAIGCVRGLRTLRGPSAVGDSTTRAVVAGIVLIIATDMVFGVIYFALGI